MLLNRQRDERTTSCSPSTPAPTNPNTLAGIKSSTRAPSTPGGEDFRSRQAPFRGRPLVINSSVQVLQTFLFFHRRHPAVLVCWTIGQQAFNASMILLLDACEAENELNVWLVDEALKVFEELHQSGVHKLAELAVRRITEGTIIVNTRRQDRKTAASAGAPTTTSAAVSWRSSQHQYRQQQTFKYSPFSPDHRLYLPIPSLNATGPALVDCSSNTIMRSTVMGATGMFLLEDPGVQFQNHT